MTPAEPCQPDIIADGHYFKGYSVEVLITPPNVLYLMSAMLLNVLCSRNDLEPEILKVFSSCGAFEDPQMGG